MRALVHLLARPKRILAIIASTLAGLLYMWFASVHAVPGVKRRKADLRASRARRWSA